LGEHAKERYATALDDDLCSSCICLHCRSCTERGAVTVDNFKRAETDHYLAMNVKDAGGLGKLHHSREPADIDKQTVIRMNRDTLYSFVAFDLAA